MHIYIYIYMYIEQKLVELLFSDRVAAGIHETFLLSLGRMMTSTEVSTCHIYVYIYIYMNDVGIHMYGCVYICT
jgi:hypothetical protein